MWEYHRQLSRKYLWQSLVILIIDLNFQINYIMGCSGSSISVEPLGIKKSSALGKKDGQEELI